MDSLDLVQRGMLIEEVFGTYVPNDDAEGFGSPEEIVDWLEPTQSNRRLNKRAADLLRRLARTQERSELAEGVDEMWWREQIAAIVREVFK
jgi:hypothetical protein